MRLEPNEIHVWSSDLTIPPKQAEKKLALLSSNECERAKRFRFPIHGRRFIAARSTLRHILSLYLNISPNEIEFGYAEHKKPYLHIPNLPIPNNPRLQFNLAHSHDIAIYAFTLSYAVGIDIEKIKETYDPAVAERFFSPHEFKDLMKLPSKDRITTFYRIWSRKEAVIKAVGKGLSIPLSTFSVSSNDVSETITIEHEAWSLIPLSIHPDYQSALASNQIVKKISYWIYSEHGYTLDNISQL